MSNQFTEGLQKKAAIYNQGDYTSFWIQLKYFKHTNMYNDDEQVRVENTDLKFWGGGGSQWWGH